MPWVLETETHTKEEMVIILKNSTHKAVLMFSYDELMTAFKTKKNNLSVIDNKSWEGKKEQKR